MIKKLTYISFIFLILGALILWNINVCNFSSFKQVKQSITVFGINPFSACVSHIVPDSLNIYRKIKSINFKDRVPNEPITKNEIEGRGKEIYYSSCASCHSSGLLDSPKFGDINAWQKISAKGLNELLNTTIKGINGMPPRGSCPSCSNRDLTLAIKFLIEGKQLNIDLGEQKTLQKREMFEISKPQIKRGKPILYKKENFEIVKKDTWYRSHANNENTKFFKTNPEINDKSRELSLAWKYDFFDAENKSKFYQENIELNPIFYKGYLYVLGPDFRFISFKPKNGEINWEIMLPPVKGMAPKRGILAYKDKIYLNVGAKLFAFNYLSGQIDRYFGKKGVYSGGSLLAPFVYKDVVYVVSLDGYLRGFAVDSGKLISQIPYRNKKYPGFASLPWGGVALDSTNGLVYFTTGNAKPDIYGVSREGSNPGSSTLFCIDLNEKEILWAFQETQHDLWDYDLPSPPIIADIKVSEEEYLKLVISVSKTGNILIFDRLNGTNLHDINWIEVNTETNVPNEILSPVQINSSLPERLIRIEYKPDDFNYQVKEETRKIKNFLSRSNLGFFPAPMIGKPAVIYGLHGGGEWPGSSVNQNSNRLFTPVNQIPWKLRIEGTSEKDYKSLSQEFINSWGNAYKKYIDKCSKCHSKKRNGIHKVVREKEIEYLPSLNGLVLLGYSDLEDFLNLFNSSHKEKIFKKTDLEEQYSFMKAWDEELLRSNSISFNGSWSQLLDSYGNYATDLPYGKIVSTNILTGKIEWETFVGETKLKYKSRSESNKEFLRKGKSMFGGLASSDDGLLYVTGSDDSKLFILDQESGKILYEKTLTAAGSAPPTLFNLDGRTHVAIIATGGLYHNYPKIGSSIYVYRH